MSEIAPALVSAAVIAPPRAAPMPSRWRDYMTLTKPRIMSLLVLTSVCAMVAAAHGDPSPVRLIALVIGGALACGGASALNHVLDRDIDRLMGPRTATRPVAAGRITPGHAVTFGLALLALSFLVLMALDDPLAATLSLAGAAFYVLVYTVWLKRRTAQNIVIGGTAGAIPPLAGWAAANGRIGVGAVWLFAIVLLWTPPHFWALALILERRYAAAEIPMLPVVRGTAATATQILVYSIVLTLITLAPGVVGTFGAVYLVMASLLGLALCALAVRLWRRPTPAAASALFHFSLLYLALLFVSAAVGAGVR